MNKKDNEYRRLDFSKINTQRFSTASSEESLRDIAPIQWSKEVLNGEKRIRITR